MMKPTDRQVQEMASLSRHVHVRQAHVAGDLFPGRMTNPRHCPLEREGSKCEHNGSRTSSPEVAEGFEATSAGAHARCDWQRQAKPS